MTTRPTSFTNVITESVIGEVGSLGGRVVKLLTASTLLIGDVVYVSAANTVAKSTTNANYAGFAGVVVGGATYDSQGSVCGDPTLVGQTAAVSGEFVLVQIDGIAYIKSDGAILAGSLVIPDATVAGECDVAGANPNYTLGISLVAAADGAVGRILIKQSYNEA
jgi:hypothetical protein